MHYNHIKYIIKCQFVPDLHFVATAHPEQLITGDCGKKWLFEQAETSSRIKLRVGGQLPWLAGFIEGMKETDKQEVMHMEFLW